MYICMIKNIEKWVNIMLVKSPLLLVCGKVFIVKIFWLLQPYFDHLACLLHT